MATIIKKMKGGRPYFYLVESARVNGKPRIVRQVYLGKAEDLLARLDSETEPREVVVREAGASVAAFVFSQRLGLGEIVDTVAPKRRQGTSVGTYITLASINRVAAPCSKRQISSWYKSSAISALLKQKETDLTPQRFWDAMGRLGNDKLARIERELMQVILEDFGVESSCLVIDGTNFFTFIDSATESELAKRGRSKQKRHDLRQIGLALLVSTDHSVPLLSLCVPGNMPDTRSFSSLADELTHRYRQLAAETEEITLIFDKGNNSAQNLRAIGTRYHFVGSLVPSHHKDLLSIDLKEFREPGNGLKGVVTCRTTKEVFGVERTLVATFSQELFDKQERGLNQTLSKALGQLASLKADTERPRSRRTTEQIAQIVQEILKPRWAAQIIKVDIGKTANRVALSYHIDQGALGRIRTTYFGKRILFTDRSDLSDAEIVKLYRAQNTVESAFRQMKDPQFLSFWPMFHWTDDKIRVHVFYCVVALLLTNLMWRQVTAAGIDISPKAMLKELSDIRIVDLIYAPAGGRGRPRVKRTLSRLSDLQRQLIRALDIEQHLPVGNTP